MLNTNTTITDHLHEQQSLQDWAHSCCLAH